MFYELIVLGLACLAAPFCARMAGFETRRKPFDMVGAGGIFFLLGASFNLAGGIFASMMPMLSWMLMISFFLGWMGLLVGAFWITSDVFRDPLQGMLHNKM